ncbi:hypothetical protein SCLCIDRAFT_538452 [Scleroderma citrinum Foug A]|uniref:Uncharacterized protein n=1 Tax=Scleroderma citrinum Foug A TaxID=1036808 RepID=A0A0C3EBD9_9AGAM|nr:hypothetical protein SCLCIDRAFT_538452 [Scleroderma citrinum Foug A]
MRKYQKVRAAVGSRVASERKRCYRGEGGTEARGQEWNKKKPSKAPAMNGQELRVTISKKKTPLDPKPIVYVHHNHPREEGLLPLGRGLRWTTGPSSSSYSSTSYSISSLSGSFMISSSMVIAVVRGIAVENGDETTLGVGEAARRVLAGGGTVTVRGGRVSYWMMVFVSVSAITSGGSSWTREQAVSKRVRVCDENDQLATQNK